MLLLNLTAKCDGDDCDHEEPVHAPVQSGMMNMLVIPPTPAPDGWGYRKGKLVCPTCLSKPDLQLVEKK